MQESQMAEEDFLQRMERHMDAKKHKLKQIEQVIYKDASFKPTIYSKDELAVKYYERYIKRQE